MCDLLSVFVATPMKADRRLFSMENSSESLALVRKQLKMCDRRDEVS